MSNKFELMREALVRLEQSGSTFDEAVLEIIQMSAALGAVTAGSSTIGAHLRQIADKIEQNIPSDPRH